MTLEIDIDGWPSGKWEELAEQSVEAVANVAPELANPRLHTSILFTSDEEVHALNKQWRDRDKPTNVLSFPMLTRDELLELGANGPPVMPPILLGDIALAHETCAREAAEKSIAVEHHASHLIIHGLLHLAGYDHVNCDAEADKMESLEIAALAIIGIADPYSHS